jgi:hypothetical protein
VARHGWTGGEGVEEDADFEGRPVADAGDVGPELPVVSAVPEAGIVADAIVTQPDVMGSSAVASVPSRSASRRGGSRSPSQSDGEGSAAALSTHEWPPVAMAGSERGHRHRDAADEGSGSDEASEGSGFDGRVPGVRAELPAPLDFSSAPHGKRLVPVASVDYPPFLGEPTGPRDLPLLGPDGLSDVRRLVFRPSVPVRVGRLAPELVRRLGRTGELLDREFASRQQDLAEAMHFAVTLFGSIGSGSSRELVRDLAQRQVELLAHQWRSLADRARELELTPDPSTTAALLAAVSSQPAKHVGFASGDEWARARERDAEAASQAALLSLARRGAAVSASRGGGPAAAGGRSGRRGGRRDWGRGGRRGGGAGRGGQVTATSASAGQRGTAGEFFRGRRRSRGGESPVPQRGESWGPAAKQQSH